MVSAASLRTVETTMGLDCWGKLAVRSRGFVMRLLSRTGRIGSEAPAAGSSSLFAAALTRFVCADMIESKDSEFRQDVSVVLQLRFFVKLPRTSWWTLVVRNPKSLSGVNTKA